MLLGSDIPLRMTRLVQGKLPRLLESIHLGAGSQIRTDHLWFTRPAHRRLCFSGNIRTDTNFPVLTLEYQMGHWNMKTLERCLTILTPPPPAASSHETGV